MTLLAGLIGDPVAHSRSPALHNAAFGHLGIDARYELWLTGAPDLPARVATLRASGVLGANVTLPHKIAVLPLLDRVDPLAMTIGAVNTVVREADGSLTGTNTDAPAFLAALREDAGYTPAAQTAVILGASGAARAAAAALIGAGVSALVVANRSPERAAALLGDMALTIHTRPEAQLVALALDSDELSAWLARATLIVNATSVGWHADETPIAAHMIPAGTLVYDMVYRPTRLLREAASRGARACDGLGMLVRQAALAFERWTGRPAPLEVMRAAVC
jgi:shikimate dehydrogenase